MCSPERLLLMLMAMMMLNCQHILVLQKEDWLQMTVLDF